MIEAELRRYAEVKDILEDPIFEREFLKLCELTRPSNSPPGTSNKLGYQILSAFKAFSKSCERRLNEQSETGQAFT